MKGVYTTLQCPKDIWGDVQDVDSQMALQEMGTAPSSDASNMMQATCLYPGDSCLVSCTHLSVPLGHSWLKL